MVKPIEVNLAGDVFSYLTGRKYVVITAKWYAKELLYHAANIKISVVVKQL